MNPVEFYLADGWRVTSPFGMRTDPFGSGAMVMHYGVDFGDKPLGYPVKTPYPGPVTIVGEFGGRGKTVVMRITKNTLQLCQHLSEYRCKAGDYRSAGDVVGTNGATGRVTGAHLHYELRIDDGTALGSPVWGNPADFTLEDKAMLEYAIIYYGTPDLYLAEPLAARYKAPLYPLRLADAVNAKTVFTVGGPEIDVPGTGEVIRLSGETRYHTAKAVADQLGIKL